MLSKAASLFTKHEPQRSVHNFSLCIIENPGAVKQSVSIIELLATFLGKNDYDNIVTISQNDCQQSINRASSECQQSVNSESTERQQCGNKC
jgi:hypothetical protein